MDKAFGFYYLMIICTAFGCKSKQPQEAIGPTYSGVEYAKNFTIEELAGYTRVRVLDPWPNAGLQFEYALVPKSGPLPQETGQALIIRTPVEKIVVTSTSHIPLLEYLDASESLIAFPNTDFISSVRIRVLIDQGKVVDLGPLAGINVEALLELQPDLIMGYGSGREYETFQRMTDLGLPVIMNADYMEPSALGRAEWIKFASVFLNQRDKADSIFGVIAHDYDSLKALAEVTRSRPSVFSGVMYGDTWFMPGGENFAAQFIRHAGGNYLWSDNTDPGWLELSFESVYENAHDADQWIGVASFASLDEIAQSDHRYAQFKAFTNGEVYNYNARIGEKGGFQFLELGYLRPDLALADLIKIIHPELLPGYELYFYQELD